MKKNVAAVVSAMGALLAIIVDLVRFIRECGGNVGEDIYRLAQPEGQETLRSIAILITEAGQKAKNCFKLAVDYSQSLAQMIAAINYYYVNSDITAEHFPVKGEGKQEVVVELLHFNRYFKNGDEVLTKIAKLGYRPATLPELLALGKAQPNLQKDFPIVALGSVWRGPDGYRNAPSLDWNDSERDLFLYWLEGDFNGYWRFAVVRQVSS